LEESVMEQAAAVREVFQECFVTGYEPLIEGLELPDPDDRHVLAAAIKCSAQIIVTENLKDFPPEALEEHGIEVLGVDDALVNTFDLFPIEGARALRTVRQQAVRVSLRPHQIWHAKTCSNGPFCDRVSLARIIHQAPAISFRRAELAGLTASF
jgi:hypothetical protein